MLLPLAPRAQGAMRSSFGDDKWLARWARWVWVVERCLIRFLDRVHVGEARRTTFGLRPAVNQRPLHIKTSQEPWKLTTVTATMSMHICDIRSILCVHQWSCSMINYHKTMLFA